MPQRHLHHVLHAVNRARAVRRSSLGVGGAAGAGSGLPALELSRPYLSADSITTPTLIMGGERDWNVPIMNSEQLYQALRRLGRTTELVVHPGQPHGIGKPSYQKDRYERYLAWYEKYVKGN